MLRISLVHIILASRYTDKISFLAMRNRTLLFLKKFGISGRVWNEKCQKSKIVIEDRFQLSSKERFTVTRKQVLLNFNVMSFGGGPERAEIPHTFKVS